MCLEDKCAVASIPGSYLMAVNYQVHHTLEGGTNKTLWMNQLRPRTRKITHRPSGQTQTFSVTMKNSVIISILWMCVPAIFPESFGLLLQFLKIYLLISSMFLHFYIHSFIHLSDLHFYIHSFIYQIYAYFLKVYFPGTTGSFQSHLPLN